LFACLAPIPWGGRWPARPSLQITVARFGNPGEQKADFGPERKFDSSRERSPEWQIYSETCLMTQASDSVCLERGHGSFL
jgi:hypothetical protein